MFLQRPSFPDLIVSCSHGHDSGVQILECLAMTPEDQQTVATAEQHPVVQVAR
jgi:hypothetical protein